MFKKFYGSIVAIVTPMNEDGSIDFNALRDLIEWHIDCGTNAIVPCGTTGESPTLTHDEHDAIIDFTVKTVNKRIPVIAGCGSNATAESIRLIRNAEKVGADGALVITPYYNKPTQAGLIAHYSAIASSANLPIVVYNVPARTGINLLPETAIELSKIKNIVAIKEASGTVDNSAAILNSCELAVLSGEDSLTLPIMALGGLGIISVVANVFPKEMAQLTAALSNNDYETARKIHRKLFNIFKIMFIETNPIPVKAALAYMGKIKETYRLPLVPMSDVSRQKLYQALDSIK